MSYERILTSDSSKALIDEDEKQNSDPVVDTTIYIDDWKMMYELDRYMIDVIKIYR